MNGVKTLWTDSMPGSEFVAFSKRKNLQVRP